MIIPKDCLLCDVCNDQLSDAKFIATEGSTWYEGWLYCRTCELKYKPFNWIKLILHIEKGDDLSKTDLALPMVFE